MSDLGGMTRVAASETAKAGAVAVLPIGSIEQHGEHLPLDTDLFLVNAVAKAAVASAGKGSLAVLAPPLPFGCSSHHLDYSGTLSLEYETFINVVCEVSRCLVRHGFRKLLLLNGHGGNMPALMIAANKIERGCEGVRAAAANYWSLIAEEIASIRETGPGGMGHAGEFETSLSLYLRPDSVRKDLMKKEIPGPRLPGDSLDLVIGGGLYLPWIVHRDTPSGVSGDPFAATADKGRRFFDAAVSKIAELLRRMKDAA